MIFNIDVLYHTRLLGLFRSIPSLFLVSTTIEWNQKAEHKKEEKAEPDLAASRDPACKRKRPERPLEAQSQKGFTQHRFLRQISEFLVAETMKAGRPLRSEWANLLVSSKNMFGRKEEEDLEFK